MTVLTSLKKFTDKAYRDGFLRAQIGGGIAYQVQALRAKLGKTQAEFGELTGKTQNQISRLENSASGTANVQTLVDIAAGANVALLVQFVSYPEFLRRTENMTIAALQPDTIYESVEAAKRPRSPGVTNFVSRLHDPQVSRPEQSGGNDLKALLGNSLLPPQGEAQQPKAEAILWN